MFSTRYIGISLDLRLCKQTGLQPHAMVEVETPNSNFEAACLGSLGTFSTGCIGIILDLGVPVQTKRAATIEVATPNGTTF